ncbi:hypothetical protein HOLleu_07288 [Holothuria leucospilota]|uniref:Uncharacterized protein n=1 Tax=Holothuria leucospilota TaxID=206669 RepID=A0A9Q1HGX0_HOLLE|nr:hypothetical protein HOLleu_07288 [Holothuria leucospilota]
MVRVCRVADALGDGSHALLTSVITLGFAPDQVSVSGAANGQYTPEAGPESSRHERVNDRIHTGVDKTASVDEDLDKDEIALFKHIRETSNEPNHVMR